jgi:hypothetical protein
MPLKRSISIKDFKYGLIDSIEAESIPRGASSRSLNFLTSGVKIELRRGAALLGTTENTGSGRITGLGVAKKPDGTDILFRTRKRKIEYYNTATTDWSEVGSDTMPAAVVATDALGEDISIQGYVNTTGPQVWFNSKNCGPIKIMTANPGSSAALYILGTNYKGFMRIKSGRMFVWNRFGNPPNAVDLFASKLDTKGSGDYTQITGEVTAPSGTLAFKAGGTKRICFEVVITVTSGGEVFTDNGDGTLTGSNGTTGATINYMTGAYTGVGIGTADYRWADDSAGGIADFAFSATRTAGQGFVLKQALGGAFQNLMSLNGKEYCLHKTATWVVDVSTDDLSISNLIFRSRVGIPNHRAAVETGDGIYYIDDTDQFDVQFRRLTLEPQTVEVVPKSMSRQFKVADVFVGVDLSGYTFDKAAAIEFGNYILFACRTNASTVNNRVFIYNKVNKAFDILDLYVSCFANYNGTLVAGDSLTDNVYTLFSGVDDNQNNINAYWESSLDNFGFGGLKRVVEITVDGEIGPEQSAKLYMATDRGGFTEVKSQSDMTDGTNAIEGAGDYVDKTQSINVGSNTLGRGEVGGGSSGISAYHYRRTFRISLSKFEYLKFKVVPQGLGYFSLTELTFEDVRLKSTKKPARYRVGR